MGLLRATVRAVVEHGSKGNFTSVPSAAVDEHASPLHGFPDWLLVILALFCLLLAACASGMTLGYMSLDTIGLEIVSNGTNAVEAAAAAVILPVRKQGNLLLCTLLLTNTLATELLPLVLEALYPGSSRFRCALSCGVKNALSGLRFSFVDTSAYVCILIVRFRWSFCSHYECSISHHFL